MKSSAQGKREPCHASAGTCARESLSECERKEISARMKSDARRKGPGQSLWNPWQPWRAPLRLPPIRRPIRNSKAVRAKSLLHTDTMH